MSAAMNTMSTSRPYESLKLATWEAITEAFENFANPKLRVNSEGEWSQEMWVFRGLKKHSYPLQPSIERGAGPSMPWATLERKILFEEFQPKAQMHMEPGSLPQSGDVLSWLALMQHHGVPTRLLDFTLSPYVALYFALRERTREEKSSSHVAVWAIDARALMGVATRIDGQAYQEEVKHKVQKPRRFPRLRLSQIVASAQSEADVFRTQSEAWKRMLADALSPHPVRRHYFERKGFVAFALPSVQNRRLSSQQGAFLFNGAEKLTFQESLFRMMNGAKKGWCRQFRIPKMALAGIEEKLFQMNIHDLSLFPDIQGLAGFVRQKLRLYWVADDSASGEQA